MIYLNAILEILSTFSLKSSTSLSHGKQKRKPNAVNDVTVVSISDKQTFIEHQRKAQIIKYFGIQLFTSCRIYISNILFKVMGTLKFFLYLFWKQQSFLTFCIKHPPPPPPPPRKYVLLLCVSSVHGLTIAPGCLIN